MADSSGMQPPFLDPSSYPDYMDMQRKQMLAQMLMQNTQQSNQTPESWNSMKVVPHRGAIQGLSTLANALMASKMMKGSQDAQQQYFQKMYGGQPQQGPPTGPGAGIVSPDAPPDQQAAAQGVTDQPPRSGLLPQQPNPMLPPGVSRGTAQAALGMMGPEEYAKGVMLPQLMGSPEWQTALRMNNGNVQAAQAQLLAEARKKGTIERRPGGEADIPDPTAPDGYRTVRTPNLSPDMEYERDAQGNLVARNITGAVPALAAQKGAVTAAEEQNKPRMIPMGGGVERLGYPQDVGAGLPPALRPPQGIMPPAAGASPGLAAPGQGQQASPQPAPPAQSAPRYFPQPQAAAPSQPAPQAPAGPALPKLPTRASGDTGVFDNNLWNGIPKIQIPHTPGQSSDAYTQAIIKDSADKHKELVNKFNDASALATQSNGYYQSALKELPAAEVGPMSAYLTHNRALILQAAHTMGVDGMLKSVLPASGTIAPTIELNKALTSAGLMGAKANFGRITQGEVMMQKEEMSPSAKMTHDAIADLIHNAQIRNAYAIQQDKDYGEYHAQSGDPMRFEGQYSQRRSLTRFANQYDTPQPALERLHKNPHMLPDFKAKFGWDPTQ